MSFWEKCLIKAIASGEAVTATHMLLGIVFFLVEGKL